MRSTSQFLSTASDYSSIASFVCKLHNLNAQKWFLTLYQSSITLSRNCSGRNDCMTSILELVHLPNLLNSKLYKNHFALYQLLSIQDSSMVNTVIHLDFQDNHGHKVTFSNNITHFSICIHFSDMSPAKASLYKICTSLMIGILHTSYRDDKAPIYNSCRNFYHTHLTCIWFYS